MTNNLLKIINNIINDIENASPVARDKLIEIYPISFLLSLKGHKNIYFSLDKNSKNISFEKTSHIDFEIRSSIKEVLDLILCKKIKKEIIYGDNEKAILMIEFIKEFLEFLRERKKYWLLPIIIVLALFGILIVLSQGSAVAPFIYTIF